MASGGIVLGEDVAVDDDGHGDVACFDGGDEAPVGDAGVELLAGAAVDGDHADAGLASAMRARARARCRLAWSQPMRILSVTGTATRLDGGFQDAGRRRPRRA